MNLVDRGAIDIRPRGAKAKSIALLIVGWLAQEALSHPSRGHDRLLAAALRVVASPTSPRLVARSPLGNASAALSGRPLPGTHDDPGLPRLRHLYPVAEE